MLISTERKPRRPPSELPPHDRLTRALHWVTAALVLTLYSLSLLWERMPRGMAKHLAIVTHMSLGITLTFVLIIRIGWRLSSDSSPTFREPGLQGIAARAVHQLLYILLVLQVLLGWNYRWAEGEPLSFLGLSISSPFTYPDQAAWMIGVAHYWVGTAIIATSSVHIIAALMHRYVLHDQVLYRMLPRRSPRNNTAIN